MKKSSHNTSGYKGVSKRNNKWSASIHKDNQKIHLGYFHTAKEAAKAYDTKAKELFGEFANVNNT